VVQIIVKFIGKEIRLTLVNMGRSEKKKDREIFPATCRKRKNSLLK
jgi:hypothetical protein